MEAMQRQDSLRRQEEAETEAGKASRPSAASSESQAQSMAPATPSRYPTLATSWQLPGRDKHAGPSKVRMYDPAPLPVSTGPVPRPPQLQAPPPPHQVQAHAFQPRRLGMGLVGSKHAPIPLDAASPSRTTTTTMAAHPHPSALVPGARPPLANVAIPQQQQRQQHIVDLSQDDGPSKPLSRSAADDAAAAAMMDIDGHARALPDLGGNTYSSTLTASERDRQLQDMMDAMVLVPDADDDEMQQAAHVEGLECTLMPHQVAGLVWMKQREAGRYKGGILADDMGLGKTVQMLALIVANSPKRADSTVGYVRQTDDRDAYRGAAPKKKADKANKAAAAAPTDAQDAAEDRGQKLALRSRTTLILAPLAVIRQWEREAKEKVKPRLKVLVHHGPQRAKDASAFAMYDVVISTYTTASSEWSNVVGSREEEQEEAGKDSAESSDELDSDDSDSDSDSDSQAKRARERQQKKKKAIKKNRSKKSAAPLFDAYWLRLVLDEAQNIKNHKTKAAQACVALGLRAHARWCLSGTPIQNDAFEMFSLIQFLGIPPFDSYDLFKEKIGDPLKSTNQNRVNWGMKRLCIVLQTIMLRRTKDATTDEGKPLLELPRRTIEVVERDFDDDDERHFYRELEQRAREKLEREQQGSKTGKVNHMVTLLMLLRLRQACSHPALTMRDLDADEAKAPVPDKRPGEEEQDDGDDSNGEAGGDDDGGLADLLSGLTVQAKPKSEEEKALAADEQGKTTDWRTPGRPSTKIRMMLSLIDACPRSEKLIIFSQFTSFMDLVEPFLRDAGHTHVRYDGRMRPADRERALERIRDDAETRIILVSFKAGSTGLNLTCCSRVVLMDLWWNPQIEEQAFDRAHRLGQKKDVVIYKLSIANSVEERILALQEKKRALSKAALEGSKFSKKSGANKLDHKELLYLFSGNVAF